MKEECLKVMTRAWAVFFIALAMGMVISAQAGPPALSTNPGKHVIFPAKGQTAEQQKQDESAAYDWATQQTGGWDPYAEQQRVEQTGGALAQTADGARGGAVKGAAGGALLGAAIGAIAGDTGKGAAIGATALGVTGGARSHRTRKMAGGASDAAVAAYQEQFAVWDRNFVAAMEGKGYTVN